MKMYTGIAVGIIILNIFFHAKAADCPHLNVADLTTGKSDCSAQLLGFICQNLRHKKYTVDPRERYVNLSGSHYLVSCYVHQWWYASTYCTSLGGELYSELIPEITTVASDKKLQEYCSKFWLNGKGAQGAPLVITDAPIVIVTPNGGDGLTSSALLLSLFYLALRLL